MSAAAAANYASLAKANLVGLIYTAIKSAADIPQPLTPATLKALISSAEKIKYFPMGNAKTGMSWGYVEGSVQRKATGLVKPKNTECSETAIPNEEINAIRTADIAIRQGKAPCAACRGFYQGWAKKINQTIIVLSDVSDGRFFKADCICIFPSQGGVYLLLSDDIKNVCP